MEKKTNEQMRLSINRG